jgi:hypothetical protein
VIGFQKTCNSRAPDVRCAQSGVACRNMRHPDEPQSASVRQPYKPPMQHLRNQEIGLAMKLPIMGFEAIDLNPYPRHSASRSEAEQPSTSRYMMSPWTASRCDSTFLKLSDWSTLQTLVTRCLSTPRASACRSAMMRLSNLIPWQAIRKPEDTHGSQFIFSAVKTIMCIRRRMHPGYNVGAASSA